jgi:hypothetical protein
MRRGRALVRSQKQLDRVLDEIEESPGIVLFTLLEKDLVGRLEVITAVRILAATPSRTYCSGGLPDPSRSTAHT